VQESKDPKSTATAGGGDDTATPKTGEPGSDATSDETLSELEETGKISGTQEGSERGGRPSSAPSPDGAFDEGGSRGPREDPGPM
jgi:hypothetical protein